FLVPEPGLLEAVEGLDEAAAVDGVAWVRIYPEPGTVLGPLGAAPTGPAQCSPSVPTARRRSDALAARRTAYASSLPMSQQKLSSRRSTFLGFQPPAVGDEEIAA